MPFLYIKEVAQKVYLKTSIDILISKLFVPLCFLSSILEGKSDGIVVPTVLACLSALLLSLSKVLAFVHAHLEYSGKSVFQNFVLKIFFSYLL